MTENKKKKRGLRVVLVVLPLIVLCLAATYFGGVAVVSTMHGETNYLHIVLGNHAASVVRKISVSNLVEVISGLMGDNSSMVLNGAIAANDTTLTVRRTPVPGFLSLTTLLAVDAYTTNCEVRAVSSLAGATYTVSSAFKLAHSSGAKVLVITDGRVSPVMYGAAANGTTDDWRAVQRGSLEAGLVGGILFGGVDYETRMMAIKQPVWVAESIWEWIRLIAPASFDANCIQTTTTNAAAAIKTFRNYSAFSGFADTNTIIYTGVPGYTVGKLVSFNNPYGETLPGGIVSGRIYMVKTLNDSAGWMTLSEIATPGDELDITSNGTGYVWGNGSSNTRIKFNRVDMTLRATNLNGWYFNLQQPAAGYKCRVRMEAPGTNIGFQVVGQGSDWYGLQVDPYTPGTPTAGSTNQIAISIEGIYNIFEGLTSVNGQGKAAVRVTGRAHKISFLLAESIYGQGVQIMPSTSGFQLLGGYQSTPNATIPFIDDLSLADSSYEVGPFMSGSGDNMMLRDVTRGYTINAWDGSATSGAGDTDNNNVYPGHTQLQGYSSPQLRARRWQAAVNDNRAFRHIDSGATIDSSGGSFTNALPDAAGWRGLMFELLKGHAANSVYVTNKAGAANTINGVTTMLQMTNVGQSMRFISDGVSDWRLIGP